MAMAEDEDWFEKAFDREDADESEEDEEPEPATERGEEPTAEPAEPDSSEDEFAEAFGATEPDESDESEKLDDSDEPEDRPTDEDFEAAFSGGGGGDGAEESTGDDFEAAFRGNTQDSEGGFEDAFGGGGGGGGGDDFEAAFGGGGGGDGGDFGFDLGAGGGTDDFEEEAYESDIPRIKLGIEGLDNMVQGGVPERSLIVSLGSAGTGKTTFGLQFLDHALKNDERAVFITLEETEDRIIKSANEKGWNFSEHVENGDLAVIDLDPVEMANSLTSIRNELPRLVEDFGASRLVLDSVSLLEMMYDDQATRRTEIYDFTKSLKRAGVTTMLTSEASEDNPYASRHGIIEYLTDAVFVLRYIRPEDFRETRLAVEIQKIRDANHSRETKPYEITGQGISVYRQANIF